MGGRGTELARRGGDGVVVSLLWRRADDRLTVVVNDTRTGEVLKLPARRDNGSTSSTTRTRTGGRGPPERPGLPPAARQLMRPGGCGREERMPAGTGRRPGGHRPARIGPGGSLRRAPASGRSGQRSPRPAATPARRRPRPGPGVPRGAEGDPGDTGGRLHDAPAELLGLAQGLRDVRDADEEDAHRLAALHRPDAARDRPSTPVFT